jgi:hypothetical protein
MFFTAIITLLLSGVALAVPTGLQVRADSCAPSNYTISDFLITTNPDGHAHVDFNWYETAVPNTT